MIRFEQPDVADQFLVAFAGPMSELTPAQVMWLIKLAKHIRGRCRSNAALRTYLARTFSHLNFDEVDREYNGKAYKSLQVSVKTRRGQPVPGVLQKKWEAAAETDDDSGDE